MAKTQQSTFIDKDTGYATLMTNIRSSKGRAVFVGFLRSSAAYVGEGVTVASVAAIQEFGSSDGKIPARPFMGPSVDQNEKRIIKFIEIALARIESKSYSEIAALRRLGLLVQTLMREKIVKGPFLALAIATLRARRARGIQGNSPLVATGHMVASVDFEVTDANGKSGGTA